MKVLTGLLLGTVISIAFTADAFADPLALAKKYWNSNDGGTGFYLGLSGNVGTVKDIQTGYLDKTVPEQVQFPSPDSIWNLEDAAGAKIQLGQDWGKIRTDFRLGALKSSVQDIDGNVLQSGTSNQAVFAYSTLNLSWDIFNLELIDYGLIDVALTPYVGVGAGYGGGWMTGKKDQDTNGQAVTRDRGGHGVAYTGEAGLMFSLTDFIGLTAGYNFIGLQISGEEVHSHTTEFGLRFTF